MVGRPRKPTALKELQNTARKDRVNQSEPGFALLIAEVPPDWLDEVGREHWCYFAPRLAQSGVLTEVDASFLAAASERWSVYRKAASELGEGLTVESRANGKVGKAEAVIARGALADYMAIMREYGAGAASRAKVHAEQPTPAEDPFEAFERGSR